MKRPDITKIVIPLALLAVFFVGWYVGLPPAVSHAGHGDSDTIWTCSMHPQIRQPNPGLCPICAMDLIPMTASSEGGLREVKVSAEAAALLDLRVSPVVRRAANVHVDLFGKIGYDERQVTTTTARIGGRLDRFFIDFTGTEVRKGDHIAEIYSPDLIVAQQDLIRAVNNLERVRGDGTASAVETQQRLLKSSRERLRLLELSDEQIADIEKLKAPTDLITLHAPQDGIVTKRHVVEGAYVKTGDPLFAVAGLDSVWLNMEAYESDLVWLKFAQEVTFTVDAFPGETFAGRIAYIDQEIDPMRRIVRVRVNVANEKHLLKPGMFARASVDAQVAADGSVVDPGLAGKWISPMHPEIMSDKPGKCSICGMDLVPAEELGFIEKSGDETHGDPLLVPATAVLRTGERAVVYVRVSASPDPKFEGQEIVLGARVGDYFVVESGLEEGVMVVTRGAFKLDSELQLRARPSMMNPNAGLVETPAAEAEASLLGQWGAIPRALGQLANAADEAAEKDAISTMSAAVKSVSTASFHAKTLADWTEFSSRLMNALAQGEFLEIRLAVEEAGRYLGLPNQPVLVEQSAPEKVTELRAAVDAYYALVDALAKDDQAAALAAKDPLAKALKTAGIDEHLLGQAADLKALRAALEVMSPRLIAAVRENGMDQVGSAYVIHCPMVNDDDGADWLWQGTEILNPYFGSEMLNCGTLRENLSFEPKQKPKTEIEK
jgi:Cu(I)/Ag(I) efflux system membrane fusion protein